MGTAVMAAKRPALTKTLTYFVDFKVYFTLDTNEIRTSMRIISISSKAHFDLRKSVKSLTCHFCDPET